MPQYLPAESAVGGEGGVVSYDLTYLTADGVGYATWRVPADKLEAAKAEIIRFGYVLVCAIPRSAYPLSYDGD